MLFPDLQLDDFLLRLSEGLGAEKYVEKVWGTEYWLTNTDKFCAKLLRLKGGFRCSLHYHPKKTEDFIVLDGSVRLEQRDVRGIPFDEYLYPGDKRHIEPKTPHRFSSFLPAWILEISTHHEDSDVVRITDSGPIE